MLESGVIALIRTYDSLTKEVTAAKRELLEAITNKEDYRMDRDFKIDRASKALEQAEKSLERFLNGGS